MIALAPDRGSALAGALTGLIIHVTRIADIVVTLAMLFVWAGVALAVLEIPGRRRRRSSTTNLGIGSTRSTPGCRRRS